MKLFSPILLGVTELKNRIAMAPMTRNRALDNLPNELMAKYYGQRAGAGLIITEGTSPSPNGLGYARIPGIHSVEQTSAWKLITDAVHARDGKIFIQLMHCGRVGSTLNLPPGARLLAPSAVAMNGSIWTDSQNEQPYGTPGEMTSADIRTTIGEYAQAARNAIAAGFDGVEVHGANGYLITQFLDPGANLRNDEFGGDSTRRNRFALEVVSAVVAAIGAERVGIRISPYGLFNDMSGDYTGIADQYVSLAAKLGKFSLCYLHLVDHSAMGAPRPDPATVASICREFRRAGGGNVILSGGYDRDRAEADLESGAADLVAYGRPFIANPDLVERLKINAPLNSADQATFYSSGSTGYTDYPGYTP
ncbi:MAG: alkene reductase [Desulfuromonadaceae bacterium]|nr:alkene reductase [Desulfuromonadaceae bacterium]MDD2847490.1 alkene reductase [Desulfuromonadaceae bacterium]MDD4131397.1 alkene reductase [Desulfuromonadaceae bacterium]